MDQPVPNTYTYTPVPPNTNTYTYTPVPPNINTYSTQQRPRSLGPDWAPVVVAVAMFIILSPGLLFQIPARTRVIEFGNMYTSGISILIHAVLYFCIYTILIVAIGIHIHAS